MHEAKSRRRVRYVIGWICYLLGLGLVLFLVWSIVSWAVVGLGQAWLEIPSEVRDEMIKTFTPICQGTGVLAAALWLLVLSNALITEPQDTGDPDDAGEEDE